MKLLIRPHHLLLALLASRDAFALQPLHPTRVRRLQRVRHTEPRTLALRAWRRNHTVHVAPQQPAGPPHHRVPKVDDGVARLRPHVAPGVRVIEDLESADDVEEHGYAAVVRVAHQARLGSRGVLRRHVQEAEVARGPLGQSVHGREGLRGESEVRG